MFDSRLWIRGGYQTIVWGKTELFRNQDQFNPQDVGLASLPSPRGVAHLALGDPRIWSFYDVGPLNDVRLELAVNFDQYQPIDPGVRRAVRAADRLRPATGFGSACTATSASGSPGADLPPDPWDDAEGVEVGVRLEFRWDRFSFAITDFYGYQDAPYVDTLFLYSRNVDPVSGRPRSTMTEGRCRSGDEHDCLDSGNALTEHSRQPAALRRDLLQQHRRGGQPRPDRLPRQHLRQPGAHRRRPVRPGDGTRAARGGRAERGRPGRHRDRPVRCFPGSPSSRRTGASRRRSASTPTTA